jgi:hypothetical protein
MTEIIELKKQLAELKVRLDAFEQGVSADFVKVIVDGVEYYDSKTDVTHQEALDLAAKHGLRVMESWEMHRLFVDSEEFRESLAAKWYWCASVYSGSRFGAWQFGGYGGNVSNGYRNGSSGVRAVAEVIPASSSPAF